MSGPIAGTSVGTSVTGTVMSVGESTTSPAKSGGVTPTIVNGSSLIWMILPVRWVGRERPRPEGVTEHSHWRARVLVGRG